MIPWRVRERSHDTAELMADPQPEDGVLFIANELAEAFCRGRLSGQEWQVVWVIVRQTYGYTDPDNPDLETLNPVP